MNRHERAAGASLPCITLHVGTSRADGSSNSLPSTVVALVKEGFKNMPGTGSVSTACEYSALSIALQVPDLEPHAWITRLVRVVYALDILDMAVGDPTTGLRELRLAA